MLNHIINPGFILFILIAFQPHPFICPAVSPPPQKDILIFTSGGTHGYYYRTANDILTYLDGALESTEIINMVTSGSIDNLSRLKMGMADIAVLQRDVALEAYYQTQTPFKKFEILMPLFPEALQIFTYGKPSIVSFTEFINKIKTGEIKKMAIGPPGSTSNITSRRVLNLFGLNQSDSFFDQRILAESIEDFKNGGSPQALALMMAAPVPQLSVYSDKSSKITLVSMDKGDVRHIITHITTLDEIKFESNLYPFLPKSTRSVRGVGTWAFLVASTGTLEKINFKGEKSFCGVILKKLLETKHKTPFYNTFQKNGYFEFNTYNTINSIRPKSGNYSYFFRGLPVSKELDDLLPDTGASFFAYLFVLALLSLILFTFYKSSHNIDFYKYWLRYKHFVYSATFLIISFFVISKLIIHMEHTFFNDFSVKSPLRDLSTFDVQRWLIIFVLTGFNNDIFPLSISGQMLATGATYLGWLAALFSIVREFVFNYNRRKRRSGMKKIRLSDHIVICGWNNSVPQFIKDSVSALKSSFVDKKKKIVIISTKFKKILKEDTDLQHLHDRHDIEFLHGEPRDCQILEKANITRAKTVVLVADDRTVDSDERTLLRALSISKYARQKTRKVLDNIYIIAEVNCPGFKQSLLDADVNEVICSPNITENLMIQSMLNHGITNVINSLLYYSDGNEFYIIDILKHPSLSGKTFDELLVHLRKFGIQLIGIKIGFFDKNGNPVIDTVEIKKSLVARGLIRENIINPTDKTEIDYRTSYVDQLVVVALDEIRIKRLP